MRIVRPFEVTEAALTSINVLEEVPAAYNAGTSYDTGEAVAVTSGTVSTIYESRVDANLGNTPASSPDEWREVYTIYEAYNAGTTYGAGVIVTDTATHRLKRSAAAGNTGNALDDEEWWLDYGPSNRWAAFDAQTDTQMSRADSITFTVQASGRVDTIGLLNLAGTGGNVTMTVDGVEIYNEDFTLNSSEGISGWYAWLFEPIRRKRDLVISGLPIDLNPVITVTLNNPDATASIGHFVGGFSRYIGSTEAGAGIGIIDRSRVDTDEFNRTFITERAFNKTGSFTVYVAEGDIDFVADLLADYRATPVLITGSERFTSTFAFGLIQNWNISAARPEGTLTLNTRSL